MRHLTLAALLSVVVAAPTFAQCLHGPNEDAAEKARRVAALSVVRAVNTAEWNIGMQKVGRYLPLTELRIDLTKARGFEPQFTTDGKSYSLILRDTTDSCHFAFSTNELGIIYQGYPIDYEVQPLKATQK